MVEEEAGNAGGFRAVDVDLHVVHEQALGYLEAHPLGGGRVGEGMRREQSPPHRTGRPAQDGASATYRCGRSIRNRLSTGEFLTKCDVKLLVL